MHLDVNMTLIGLTILIGLATVLSFVKEYRRRKKEILYACGFVGKPVVNMTIEEMEEESIRVREQARKHMEEVGLHFDYTEAEEKNEARLAQRIKELEEARERLQAEYQKERQKEREALNIPFKKPSTNPTPVVQMQEYIEQRGLAVLYPKNSNKWTPPQPPKTRKRYRRKDGTTTYQLGLDVSPVHGITNKQAVENRLEEVDDYPKNLEEAFRTQMNKLSEQRKAVAKEELLRKDYGIHEYRQNYQAWEEIRKRLIS